ncbi:MAG: hypothetical protein KDJ17_07260 [Hyphomicrobiaceae bacterium]|nr:hypothetical protein [Hyphomicrobiaceae bacterium]
MKAKPSSEQAKRAIAIVADYLRECQVNVAPVSTFGPLRQREFMGWSRRKFGHSPSTIARNLSVVSSAFRFGTRLQIVVDGFGNRHEVQLLDSAPVVETQAARVAALLDLPEPRAREWLPTFKQFGAFIDRIDKRQENLFRFVILALNTWARPEAITDLRVGAQVDFEHGLVDLNPPGRRQTNKHRPRLPLTTNLRGWLKAWDADAPLAWDGQAVSVIKKTFKRHAVACGLPRFTQGTIRHFMATQVRRVKPPVSQEQRDAWLGHDRKRTAEFYESFDPQFLADCRRATEKVIAELQKHASRPLSARKSRASGVETRNAKKPEKAAMPSKAWGRMVGVTGIEPVTPTMST